MTEFTAGQIKRVQDLVATYRYHNPPFQVPNPASVLLLRQVNQLPGAGEYKDRRLKISEIGSRTGGGTLLLDDSMTVQETSRKTFLETSLPRNPKLSRSSRVADLKRQLPYGAQSTSGSVWTLFVFYTQWGHQTR